MYPRIDISLRLVLGSDHYKDWEFPLGSLNPASLFSLPSLYRRGTQSSERLWFAKVTPCKVALGAHYPCHPLVHSLWANVEGREKLREENCEKNKGWGRAEGIKWSQSSPHSGGAQGAQPQTGEGFC